MNSEPEHKLATPPICGHREEQLVLWCNLGEIRHEGGARSISPSGDAALPCFCNSDPVVISNIV